VLVVVFGLVFVEPFRSPDNFSNILRQIAVVTVLALGETIVIIAGGIDLSVGSVVAFAGIATGFTAKWSALPPELAVPCAAVAGMAAGATVGLMNGLVTEWARIPPFVVTLGTMGIASGVAKLLTGGQGVESLPQGIKDIVDTNVAGVVPSAALLIVAATLVAHWLLAKTRFGRSVYALGGNREAARLSGVPVRRASIFCFVLCGLLAGVAGVISTSRVGSAQSSAGQGYELQAIAAAVIGGTSLSGGEGSATTTLAGALLLGVIANILDLKLVESHTQLVITGVIIIIAVVVDRLRLAVRPG
jgi:ribose transport system permease protein